MPAAGPLKRDEARRMAANLREAAEAVEADQGKFSPDCPTCPLYEAAWWALQAVAKFRVRERRTQRRNFHAVANNSGAIGNSGEGDRQDRIGVGLVARLPFSVMGDRKERERT